jgi:hypothetical protein
LVVLYDKDILKKMGFDLNKIDLFKNMLEKRIELLKAKYSGKNIRLLFLEVLVPQDKDVNEIKNKC